MSERKIVIGGASGGWGDSPRAVPQLLRERPDYLMMDYLAEVTMSLLARARQKDPELGYVPDFISFIIYHWDINVRISTILGFVGGGGIGYYLSQRINVLEYPKAGTAIWASVAVVWAMDFFSAEVRKRYT